MSKSPDRLIRFEASRKLRGHESIRVALNYFRENPQEFNDRTKEFDRALSGLTMQLLGHIPDINRPEALKLKKLLGRKDLPRSLRIIATFAGMTPTPSILKKVENTFDQVNIKLGGEWSGLHLLTPNQAGSWLLIHGFGLMVEEHLKVRGLHDQFALAFVEEITTRRADSKMAQDLASITTRVSL